MVMPPSSDPPASIRGVPRSEQAERVRASKTAKPKALDFIKTSKGEETRTMMPGSMPR
jgi:deoxyribose-phosphate aldolase